MVSKGKLCDSSTRLSYMDMSSTTCSNKSTMTDHCAPEKKSRAALSSSHRKAPTVASLAAAPALGTAQDKSPKGASSLGGSRAPSVAPPEASSSAVGEAEVKSPEGRSKVARSKAT